MVSRQSGRGPPSCLARIDSADSGLAWLGGSRARFARAVPSHQAGRVPPLPAAGDAHPWSFDGLADPPPRPPATRGVCLHRPVPVEANRLANGPAGRGCHVWGAAGVEHGGPGPVWSPVTRVADPVLGAGHRRLLARLATRSNEHHPRRSQPAWAARGARGGRTRGLDGDWRADRAGRPNRPAEQQRFDDVSHGSRRPLGGPAQRCRLPHQRPPAAVSAALG